MKEVERAVVFLFDIAWSRYSLSK